MLLATATDTEVSTTCPRLLRSSALPEVDYLNQPVRSLLSGSVSVAVVYTNVSIIPFADKYVGLRVPGTYNSLLQIPSM